MKEEFSQLGSPYARPFSIAADADYEALDGAFAAVPRACTVTRPSSPSPSFRTDAFSIVDWDFFAHDQQRPSVSDAAPSCSLPFAPSRYSAHGAPTPYNTLRFSTPSPIKPSRSLGILPRIWDALRESSPVKKGKRRAECPPALWFEHDSDAQIDYANLPPLDGEEGELIDDEACFIDVRAVTGIDIIALLPVELALHLLSFLDLQDILACLRVSRTWHRLAQDNAIWRDLFIRRKADGWGIDLRRSTATANAALTPASLFASAHRPPRAAPQPQPQPPAPLQLDWYELHRTRTELDRRWSGAPSIGPGGGGGADKENARVWEPRARRISGHTDSVYCLEFDSSRIITGSRDRTIKVWSLKTGRCLATFVGHRGSVLCLKFDKDWDVDPADHDNDGGDGTDGTDGEEGAGAGEWRTGFMVSGSSDCSVAVWNLYAGPRGEGGGGEGGVEGERAVSAEVRGVLQGHTGGVLDLRIDKRWIVSCSKDALIRVWNRRTLALHCTFRGHEGPVNAVGLQGARVVSASGDGTMMLWDVGSGERVRTFEGHDRGLACIEFKDDLIISGSNDCKIKVWLASTGECLRTLVGHDLLVRALSFEPASGRLVSASYDRSVKVWELRTGRVVRSFEGVHDSHIFDVKFDCSRIVSTSHDQKIVVLDFSEGLDASLFV